MTNNKNLKGSAMFFSLVIVLMVTAFASAYSGLTITQSEQVTASIEQNEGHEITMASFNMARVALANGHANGWDDELVASYNGGADPAQEIDGYFNDYTSLSSLDIGTDSGNFQWGVPFAYEGMNYMAYVTDNDDDGNPINDTDSIVVLNVGVWVPGGKSRSQIQSVVRFKPPVYEPDTAIVTNGTLKLWGSADITGTQGSIYANDYVDIGGHATVAQDVYSTGTIVGQSQVGGSCYEGAAPTNVPTISPSAHADLADYILHSDGCIYDSNMNLIGDASAARVMGWDFKSTGAGDTWQCNDANPADGTYYVSDQVLVDIAGSPGSVADPWQVTLLATGSVEVSGSPTMTPDETGVCILAGQDIDCAGNLTVIDGVVGAHEQMEISGSVDITGNLVIEDAEDTPGSLVKLTGNALDVEITGSTLVTYNGGLTTFLEGGDSYLIIKGYKRIR